MDYALESRDTWKGSKISDLPTPSLIINKATLERNIADLHRDVETIGIGFRPHVKTLKALEVTRRMLGNGKYRGIICSTLPEIAGALPLVKEGLLDEAVYGLPIAPSKLPRLSQLREAIRTILIVDHEQQITALERFNVANPDQDPWPVFIKIDVGSQRAGVPFSSPRLRDLVRRARGSEAVGILGFYAHAGHSYGGQSPEAAEKYLIEEIDGLLHAAELLNDQPKMLLSLGSTPTAHVVKTLKAKVARNVQLELHAGNFPCNDLQQVATGLVTPDRQAIRLLAEVCSVYPERNEALINAGSVAISKETSQWKGFGQVVGNPGWHVTRMSQEHGILAYGEEEHGGVLDGDHIPQATRAFEVGDKVQLYISHACITAVSFHAYFVVDDDDVIVDVWVPWKGW